MPMYLRHTCTKKLLDELVTDTQINTLLTRLREHHEESYAHSCRVCLLSLDLGIQHRLSPSDLWYLGRASLLHDIGKLEIPCELLTKPAALTPQEVNVMRQHVRLGFWTIQAMERELPAYDIVKRVAVAHHEFTTNPYPRSGRDRRHLSRLPQERRTVEQNIYYLSQIVAIADMTDALRHARAYKSDFAKEDIEYILRREFQGDPSLIDQAMWRVTEHARQVSDYF